MLTWTAKLRESQLVYIWISRYSWRLSHDLVISWLQLFRAPLHSAALRRRIQRARTPADSRPRITVQSRRNSEISYLNGNTSRIYWRFYFVNQSQQLSEFLLIYFFINQGCCSCRFMWIIRTISFSPSTLLLKKYIWMTVFWGSSAFCCANKIILGLLTAKTLDHVWKLLWSLQNY